MNEQPAATGADAVSSADQAGALFVAFGVLLALLVFGATVSQQHRGYGLSWDTINPVTALAVLEQHLTGDGCAALLQRARVTVDGQYASITIDQFGAFEVQSHYLRFHTARAVSDSPGNDTCRLTPRRPDRLIRTTGTPYGPA